MVKLLLMLLLWRIVIVLLLLNLLSHDCPSHLLLHLNYGLGVEETIGEIKDVLTLQEEGHQSALIRLCE